MMQKFPAVGVGGLPLDARVRMATYSSNAWGTKVTKPFRASVTGSYPRPVQPTDTLKKPSLSRAEADEIIRWAARDQADAGLDVVTDGEGRRENMYYFFQKRLEGISFDEMVYRHYGDTGFGIEIASVVGKLENPRFELARDWKTAREAAPPHVEVKITCTGPHLLAKFSNNKRTDLYPTDKDLALAYAGILNSELKEVVRAGCEFIQFDEPAWTAFPDEVEWAAEVLNRAIEGLNVRIGMHVCGGNPRRKRVYFTRYDDLVEGFKRVKIDQVSLEYCTLSYHMLTLWEKWKFPGEFAVGVVDQRSDAIESPETVAERTRPVLEYFPPERILISSECGFQHVPLDITRAKLRALAAAGQRLRES
jgi:5-methyltetrahydropteroyltriglutamate--homocysteine methyltransferase